MKKLIPTAGRCVIKRDDAEAKTKGGLVLPDSAKEKPARGKILAIGKGTMLENGTYAPVELTEGATVFFSRYVGVEVELDGEEFVLLAMTDVLAAIEG